MLGDSTVWDWMYWGGCLLAVYLMACKITEKHLKKWAERENRKNQNCTELERHLNMVGTYPILWVIVIFYSIGGWGAMQSIYGDLPNKITGNWPVYEGTIVEWVDGARWTQDYTHIQNGEDMKSFRLQNRNIRYGDMIGVNVRVAYNGSKALVLEYEESGSWKKVMDVPNAGREKNVVPKTIGMNLLAGIVTCGFILRKIHRPCSNSYFRSKLLHNSVGFFLILLSCINEIVLCKAVMGFPQNGVDEAFLMHSQLSMLILICINVLFCIFASQKSNVFHYWLKTAKEFYRFLAYPNS